MLADTIYVGDGSTANEIHRKRGIALDVEPSHVRQTSLASTLDETLKIKFRIDADETEVAPTETHFKCGKLTSTFEDQLKPLESRDKQLPLVDPNTLVRRLKQEDLSNFLHFRCYKRLRKKNRQDGTHTAAEAEDFGNDHDDSVQFVDSSPMTPMITGNINGTELYTEKYRPTTTEEILVNANPVVELRNFLTTWLEANAAAVAAAAAAAASSSSTPNRRGGRGRRRCDSTDSDDFESCGGTNSAPGLMSTIKNAVLLLGPSSSGKTSAVFAVANELNFKVLEVNAGAKRTGRKILQELQEATRSHQVKGSGAAGSESRQLFRTGIANSQSEESGSQQQQQPKLSLILIEDADIAFDQDIGFVDSINQLVTTSKRPIVLVANHSNCPHLSRFIRNVITFSVPNSADISRWLSLMTVAEHSFVPHEYCTKLYDHNGCDLRKTMLELQFYIQSGGDRSPKRVLGEIHHCDVMQLYGNQKLVRVPVDFDKVQRKSSKILDGISSLSTMLDVYDRFSTGLLLQRPMDPDRIVPNLSEEIAYELVKRTWKTISNTTDCTDEDVGSVGDVKR